jgi:hypothetical protein
MSMAKLEILCEYKSMSNSSGLTQLYSQIEMFARDVKEFSLREIADHSIKSLMHTNTQVKCEVIPSRLKMGLGDDGVRFDVNVAGMDYVVGDNLVIDDIETTIIKPKTSPPTP